MGFLHLEALAVLWNVLLGMAAFAVLAIILWRLVSWARRRASGAYLLGGLLSPFMGFGNVVDPDFKLVDETKRVKQKEEDEWGDPPSNMDGD